MTLREAFGQVLRAHRTERGLSQEDLAHEAGLHRNYVGVLERGEQRPTLETIKALARALGMRPSGMLAAAEAAVEQGNPPNRRDSRL